MILSAGAIGSPQLLQCSGIGPADLLARVGVPVVHALPGVGQNLQDHLEYYHQFKSKLPITLHSKNNWFWMGIVGAQWLFFKKGLGTSNQFEACAFIRSRAGIDYPDIQYHFLPIAVRYDGKAAAEGHGFQAHVGPMRSISRGSVTLRSADPAGQVLPVLFDRTPVASAVLVPGVSFSGESEVCEHALREVLWGVRGKLTGFL